MIQSLRILALALMGALVMIGLALYLVLGAEPNAFGLPELWSLAAVAVIGVGANVLIPLLGYQVQAVDPTEPRRSHTAAFQSAMFLRFALAEAVAVVSIALAFVVTEGGMLLYLIGAAISLVTMAVHVYPSDATVERFRARLERDGGTSHLREDLGLPPKLTGAIREL